MVAIVAAEELGLPLEKVSVRIGDTPDALRPGLRRLDDDALERPDDPARGLAGQAEAGRGRREGVEGPRRLGHDRARHRLGLGRPGAQALAWAEACKLLPEEGVSATAERAENHEDAWKRFTAAPSSPRSRSTRRPARSRVERIVAVHDCGLVVNATDDREPDPGRRHPGRLLRPLRGPRARPRRPAAWSTPTSSSTRSPAPSTCPEIEIVIVPVWDGVNNTHSVGIGEPATVPTAAAIANAVSHAIGARIRQLPITPEVVLAAVEAAAKTKGGRRMKPFVTGARRTRSPRPPAQSAKPDAELKAGGVDLLDRMKEGCDSPKTVVSIADDPGPRPHRGRARRRRSAPWRRSRSSPSRPGAAQALPRPRGGGGRAPPRRRSATWRPSAATSASGRAAGTTGWRSSTAARRAATTASRGTARTGSTRSSTRTSLCCCVHPSATGTALSAYGASLEIVSPKGRRTLPDRPVLLPAGRRRDPREHARGRARSSRRSRCRRRPPGARSVYRKLKEKESFDWPLVEICVALTISGGTIRNARVVFGSVAPTPLPLARRPRRS